MDGSDLLTNHSLSKRNDRVRPRGKERGRGSEGKKGGGVGRREGERKRRRERGSQKHGRKTEKLRLQAFLLSEGMQRIEPRDT